MATTPVLLPLNTEAAQIYRTSAPEGQQKISETVSSVIVNFSFMSSNSMLNSALYARDFLEWAQTTAALIRANKFYEVDREALAEEIESMGRSQKREMESRIHTLTMHLLKWSYQPEEHQYHGRSWQTTINIQRVELDLLLRDNPSLRPQRQEVLDERYPKARAHASNETGLPLATFPEICPWTIEHVLNDDFWPQTTL